MPYNTIKIWNYHTEILLTNGSAHMQLNLHCWLIIIKVSTVQIPLYWQEAHMHDLYV